MSETLNNIIGVMFIIMPPLSIQFLLYFPAKLILKKVSPHKVYTACFLINTIILLILHYYLSNDADPNEMEAMDAFDGIILYLLWTPWYLAITISCIYKIKSQNNKDEQ